MRKSELDRLLLTAVAEALGQPVPRQKRRVAKASAKRSAVRYRAAATEHHAHA